MIMYLAELIKFVFDIEENIVGNGGKCLLQSFSCFAKMFSKAFLH